MEMRSLAPDPGGFDRDAAKGAVDCLGLLVQAGIPPFTAKAENNLLIRECRVAIRFLSTEPASVEK